MSQFQGSLLNHVEVLHVWSGLRLFGSENPLQCKQMGRAVWQMQAQSQKGSHGEVHGQLWKLGNIMTGILRCSIPPFFVIHHQWISFLP